MNTVSLKTPLIAQPQKGQAMVEYAILLTVMVTLIAGGVEIGLAAFNSNRTSEAAKVGATEWLKKGLRYAIDDGTDIFLDRNGDDLKNDTWGIGDHTSSSAAATPGKGNFGNPTCSSSGHSSGLPFDAAPEDDRNPVLDPSSASYDIARQKVYLYNPLPIDITACPFASGAEFSEFAGGEEVDSDSDGVTDYIEYYLPPVNRAILSLYVKECVDSSGDIVDCTSGTVSQIFLRLPGGRHIDGTPESMTQLGLFSDQNLTTGTELDEYILRAGAGSGAAGQVDSLSGTKTGFVDSFRMHCKRQDQPSFPKWYDEDNCAVDCFDGSGFGLACDVRVIVRHRHTFESLVMMMKWKKPVAIADRAALDSPFVDNNLPNELARGVLGTEVTRGFALKPQKTFRGCYESVSDINATNRFLEVRVCN